MPKAWAGAWVGLSILGLLLLPKYYLFIGASALSTAVAIVGLVILTGYSGQISIGHGAFVGFGAYVCAILMAHLGLPYWLALPIAALATYVAGFLFGYPALRLEGLYLALATFALAVAFPQLVKSRWLQEWTGGAQGLVLDRPASPLPNLLSDDQWIFAFSALVAGLMFLLAVGIARSVLALQWKALRDHRIAGETTGISRRRSYNHAFAFSSLYAGVAGGLLVVQTQFISPESFSFFLSFTLLVGAVVGGIHSLAGALVGSAFVQFIPNIAEAISKAAPAAMYGVILLLLLAKAPDGLAGVGRRVLDRLRARHSPSDG